MGAMPPSDLEILRTLRMIWGSAKDVGSERMSTRRGGDGRVEDA